MPIIDSGIFEIQELPVITVTNPTGATELWIDDTINITWTTSGGFVGNVKIQLFKGGSSTATITNSTANDGTYSWTVASGDLNGDGTDYKIKVFETDGQPAGYSPAFEIHANRPEIEKIHDDSIAIAETFDWTESIWKIVKSKSDAVSLSEEVNKVLTTWLEDHDVSDSVAFAETIITQLFSGKAVPDAVSLSEEVNKFLTTWLKDYDVDDDVGFSEAVISRIISAHDVVDAVGFSEEVNKFLTTWLKDYDVDDDVGFSEAVNNVLRTWFKDYDVADGAGFSETVITRIISAHDVSDAVSLSEEVNKSLTTWLKDHEVADSVGFSEAVNNVLRTWFKDYDIVDSIGFSEAVNNVIRTWLNDYDVADGVGFSETIDSVVSQHTMLHHAVNEVIAFVEDVDEFISWLGSSSILSFQDSPTEVYGTSRRTGWIKASESLSRATILRRLNVEYNSADPVDVKIFADGDDVNEIYSYTLAAGVTPETINKSVRIGRRARNFMVEVSTDPSSNANVTIENLGVEVDA